MTETLKDPPPPTGHADWMPRGREPEMPTTHAPAVTVTLRAAASRLGVHENTIRNWIDKGLLLARRLPTGTRRLPLSEVERLEREMFAAPTSFPEYTQADMPKATSSDSGRPQGPLSI